MFGLGGAARCPALQAQHADGRNPLGGFRFGSPRDAQGRPGALEAALIGAPVRPDEDTPVSVQRIVRSFDPCRVCTVH